MQAQRYRHRVEIQEESTLIDPENGARITTWSTLYLDSDTPLDSVPAEVLTGPGSEPYAADGKQSSIDARINMRWFPGLLQKHRLIWEGQIFSIVGIEMDRTARREYRLKCIQGPSRGA